MGNAGVTAEVQYSGNIKNRAKNMQKPLGKKIYRYTSRRKDVCVFKVTLVSKVENIYTVIMPSKDLKLRSV